MKKTSTTHVIPVTAHKGGVGKTTTALNLAAGLANRGYSVLLIDCDQQANLTSVLCETPPEQTLYDSLLDEGIPVPVIQIRDNLGLVAASPLMYGICFRLAASIPDSFTILSRVMAPIKDEFDFIIIDTPAASDNILTISALYAADNIVMVSKPEPFSVESIKVYGKIIRAVKDKGNRQLRLAGILITDFETGSVGHLKGEEALRSWAPRFIFQTRIRHSRPVYNAVLANQDIFAYDPGSNGAKDYNCFVNEFLSRIKIV